MCRRDLLKPVYFCEFELLMPGLAGPPGPRSQGRWARGVDCDLPIVVRLLSLRQSLHSWSRNSGGKSRSSLRPAAGGLGRVVCAAVARIATALHLALHGLKSS